MDRAKVCRRSCVSSSRWRPLMEAVGPSFVLSSVQYKVVSIFDQMLKLSDRSLVGRPVGEVDAPAAIFCRRPDFQSRRPVQLE